ncbi:hypothetical protein RclHR1_27670002 [Rhizophagus clarus]|uniref:RRM domain-containing protein n=1 Tax=Rhizophagus clarus TaxID=94130 RepID=A0A2Z6R248_9GLOM|nr:hypothetical protein RclHR1_27670002 [Rhizophagus clarus]
MPALVLLTNSSGSCIHAHDPKQLRSDEDLRAIQVTDIPFFLTKDNIMSYFKKFGNIQSCRVYSRKNAKVQQARIVYDSALLSLALTPNGPFTASPPASGNHGCRYGTRSLVSEVHTLQWNLPDNTNKLCHRCGKLGCAPNQCPSRQEMGRTRGRNPVAALKERFNINQPARPKERSCSGSRSRCASKGPVTHQSSNHKNPWLAP